MRRGLPAPVTESGGWRGLDADRLAVRVEPTNNVIMTVQSNGAHRMADANKRVGSAGDSS
jgi:hypothetical protein